MKKPGAEAGTNRRRPSIWTRKDENMSKKKKTAHLAQDNCQEETYKSFFQSEEIVDLEQEKKMTFAQMNNILKSLERQAWEIETEMMSCEEDARFEELPFLEKRLGEAQAQLAFAIADVEELRRQEEKRKRKGFVMPCSKGLAPREIEFDPGVAEYFRVRC